MFNNEKDMMYIKKKKTKVGETRGMFNEVLCWLSWD